MNKIPCVDPRYIRDHSVPLRSFVEPDYVGWVCLKKWTGNTTKNYYWHITNYKLHRVDGPAILECYNENTPLYEEYWLNERMILDRDYWNHPLVIKAKLNKILEKS